MNIYDIAKKSGVSIATVSRVINGSGYVSNATRERVLSVIDKNSYIPNAIAKNLSTSSSLRLIGLLCYKIDDLYYAKAVSVLERELRKFGYDIILSCTDRAIDQIEKNLTVLLSKNVDAIILIGSVFITGGKNPHIQNAARYVPMFLINGRLSGDNIYSMYCEDYNATQEVTLSAVKQGRKNFLYIYDVLSYSGKLKQKGCYKAVLQSGLEQPQTLHCTGYEQAYMRVNALIDDKKIAADCVIAANDELAAGAYKALCDGGVKVPRECAVIGYNNSLIAEIMGITSIDNSVDKIASTTARHIHKYFEGSKFPTDLLVKHRLTVRKTFINED